MTMRTFQPATDQIPVARRFVLESVDSSDGSVDAQVKDDLALLTSEAVANAVEHARTAVAVTVWRVGPTAFLVSVHDDSPRPIPEPRTPGPQSSTAGRGLAIIDAVASRWGVEDFADDGKTIWFVATTPDDGVLVPADRGTVPPCPTSTPPPSLSSADSSPGPQTR